MTTPVSMRKWVVAISAAALAAGGAAVALAATPTIKWQTTTGGGGLFSGDGTSVLLTTATGFQMRRSSDGVVEKTVTLPAASLGFDARAFSPDKQYVAIALQSGAAFKIEVWRVSTSTLARTINTSAVRNIKTLDISSGGLIAAYERFAYGGGGFVHVFRISDGGFVTMLGPYTHNSTTRVRFSPNGTYMMAHDWVGANGVRILRTSDWGTVFTVGDFADVFRWAPDSATAWTTGMTILSVPYRQITVPGNAVQRSIAIDDTQLFPTAVTGDGRHLLGFTTGQDAIKFIRTSDGGAAVTYTGTSIFSSDISPAGNLFTYGSCPASPCTFFMAAMPSL